MDKLFAKDLYRMLTFSASKLASEADKVNALNVFPVPDGDTGSNMSMTASGVNGITEDALDGVGKCAKSAADLMLRSARGNSGVILSVFFRGFALSLGDIESAGVSELAAAFASGTEAAYGSVMNPTEGTILTIMRAASEAVAASDTSSIEEFFDIACGAAGVALEHTPDQLPLLKEAGVVDAGGCGFMIILTAMASMLSPDAEMTQGFSVPEPAKVVTNAAAACDSEIVYPYCTECIVEKSEEYAYLNAANELHEFVLQAGDSVVYVEDESIVKLHVHTSNPGSVLTKAEGFGMLLTVKIENMRKQHTSLTTQEAYAPTVADGTGFVSVTNGEGLKEIFADLGVDFVVAGGQTMNPSTEDLIDAVKKVSKKNVFVLPNNSNIILTAQQAAKFFEGQGVDVRVIPSKSVPQGITAMCSYSEEATIDENLESMTDAISSVKTLSVTRAVRDAVIGELEIKQDQFIGLVENKVKYVSDSLDGCVDLMLGELGGVGCVVAYCGEDIDESKFDGIREKLTKKLDSGTDIMVVPGGQPVYSLIISGE